MSCACKVKRHINKIEEKYGSNIRPGKKTEIVPLIKNFSKKVLFSVMLLPITPIIVLYILIKNCFGKKTFYVDKFFKK